MHPFLFLGCQLVGGGLIMKACLDQEEESMASNEMNSNAEDRHRVVAEARRDQADREKGYRARALKMYPWVCGHCAREFTLKTVIQLEVHHKDHNHDYNPPDGSNWELLCTYCHENQHARQKAAAASYSDGSSEVRGDSLTAQPFSGLAALLNKDKK